MASPEYVQIQKSIFNVLGETLFNDSDFCDVTLVCADNQHLPAHRAVICTGSDFLRELLFDSQYQRTFLYLGKVQLQDLRPLLQFLYLGSCTVEKSRLELVTDLAAELKISGFTRCLEQSKKSYVSGKTIEEITTNYEINTENENHKIIHSDKSLEQTNIDYISEESYRISTENRHLEKINSASEIGSFHLHTDEAGNVKIYDTDTYEELQDKNNKLEEGETHEILVLSQKQEFPTLILGGESISETDIINRKTINILSNRSEKQKLVRKKFKLPKTEVGDPDSNGMYNCMKCKYSSKSIHDSRRHKLIKHEGFSYPCEQCTSHFRSTDMLRVHKESIHEGLTFKCDECGQQFNKNVILLHRAKMKKCEQCSFFSCSRKVTKHSNRIHNNFYKNGTFQCDECKHHSVKLKNLLNHKRIIHSVQQFVCPHCDYQTNIKQNRNQHIREKHLLTKYKCEKCEFSDTKKRLWTHKIKVHEKRKYFCIDCEYVGMTNSKLEHHRQKIHLKVDYTCQICNLKMGTSSSYRRHMRHQHESTPVTCGQCSYVGKTSQYLDLHVKTNHMESIYRQCTQCSFKTKRRSSLSYHRETVHQGLSHSCERCGKEFNHPKSIRRHKLICGSQSRDHDLILNDIKVDNTNMIQKCLESKKNQLGTDNDSPDQLLFSCESQDCCRTLVES